jgi:hypothetical protein
VSNVRRTEVRNKIKQASKLIDESRALIAQDMFDEFDSEESHKVAEAQFAIGQAYEFLSPDNSRVRFKKGKRGSRG